MQTQSNHSAVAIDALPFQFTFHKLSSVKAEGQSADVPFLVRGLLPKGGLSVLGAKPKQGKSSLGRYLAACVSKGKPFLARETAKADVLLINLEDPNYHVANCMDALGYDEKKDGLIEVVNTLSANNDDNINALEDALASRPNVGLVIIDHLTKYLRVGDVQDYDKMQAGFMKLREVAKQFPHVHIMSLVHCKKVQQSDPFDGILGSTSLRGEPDTNIVILQTEDGHRVLTAETRIGKFIPATVLAAETVEIEDSEVVKNFALGSVYDIMKAAHEDAKQAKKKETVESRIITYLLACEDHTAPQSHIMSADNVKGRAADKSTAITTLSDAGVITIVEGHGKGSPRTVKLNQDSVSYEMFTLGKGI
jgi:RecA-family ATPase